ncbi:MAG: hypothetical protein RL757_1373 [Bacteroidota bacterium]|jgi:hypothetical protein
MSIIREEFYFVSLFFDEKYAPPSINCVFFGFFVSCFNEKIINNEKEKN